MLLSTQNFRAYMAPFFIIGSMQRADRPFLRPLTWNTGGGTGRSFHRLVSSTPEQRLIAFSCGGNICLSSFLGAFLVRKEWEAHIAFHSVLMVSLLSESLVSCPTELPLQPKPRKHQQGVQQASQYATEESPSAAPPSSPRAR